jgi:hypothetical protein
MKVPATVEILVATIETINVFLIEFHNGLVEKIFVYHSKVKLSKLDVEALELND